jgi:serine/threonine protein kinase
MSSISAQTLNSQFNYNRSGILASGNTQSAANDKFATPDAQLFGSISKTPTYPDSVFDADDCIGSGTFGLVYQNTTNLHCETEPDIERKKFFGHNNIGKIMSESSAVEEHTKYTLLKGIDDNQEYSITESFFCKPKLFPGQTLFSPVYYTKCNKVVSKPSVILYSYGGITLEEHLGEILHKSLREQDSYHRKILNILRNLSNILEGLIKYHEKGFYHTDIKSDNLVVNKEDKIRLIDFGLCHNLDYQTPNYFQRGYDSFVSSHIPIFSFFLSINPENIGDAKIDTFVKDYMVNPRITFSLKPFFSLYGKWNMEQMQTDLKQFRDSFKNKQGDSYVGQLKLLLNGFDMWGFAFVLLNISYGPIHKDFKKVLEAFIKENQLFAFNPSITPNPTVLFAKYKRELIPMLGMVYENITRQAFSGGGKKSKINKIKMKTKKKYINKTNSKSKYKIRKISEIKKNKLSRKLMNKYGGDPTEDELKELKAKLQKILETEDKDLPSYTDFTHMKTKSLYIEQAVNKTPQNAYKSAPI